VHDGSLTVAVGASRSGKTAHVKRELAKHVCWLAWDVEGQYEGRVITSAAELARICGSGADGRYSYRPRSLGDFGHWAECAFLLARVREKRFPDRVHMAVVAEETSDVTSPGKAPDGWGMLIRRGLKYGVDIYAITQRPSESDKTVMGNASIIHCCGLQRAGDRKYMALEMDIPIAELQGLDRSKLEYIHKDMRDGQWQKGRLTF
jgi:hypothetical protein